MIVQRRMRFSIGAMLVVMALVAVLLNREVQRAKAIEITVKRIEEWDGDLRFRPREGLPTFLAKTLPQYWTVESDWLVLSAYSKEPSEPLIQAMRVIDPMELDALVQLGALDNLSMVQLKGTAFDCAVISRICGSPSLEHCDLIDGALSDIEISDLWKKCSKKKLYYQRVRGPN